MVRSFDRELDLDTFLLKALVIATTCKDSQMSCCRCNKSGRCTNCVCVKSSKKCSNCLPKWMGHCRNQAEMSLDPTESAPCMTSVSNQSQEEQVTAEIHLLTGLRQQQPVEIPWKVATEEESIICTRSTTSIQAFPNDQFSLGNLDGWGSINHPEQHLWRDSSLETEPF